MNSNFFNQIAQLDFIGNLQLTITKGAESHLIVSVLLKNEQCGDSTKHLIPPLLFNATAQDLDEAFIQQMSTPIQTISDVLVDMEQFQKQMEEVKKQSAMEKDKSEKAKKEKDSKNKKLTGIMEKVDELEKEGKFREAWIKVPDRTDFPEKAEELSKRKAELSAKFSTPSLFGTMETTTDKDALYPHYTTNEEETIVEEAIESSH